MNCFRVSGAGGISYWTHGPALNGCYWQIKSIFSLHFLQTVSLGCLVAIKSTLSNTIGLHRLANISAVKELVFESTCPLDVSILRNLQSIRLESDKEFLDLSVLELCGPKLESIDVMSTRESKDGFMNINGLSLLRGLKSFRFWGQKGFCDVFLVIGKGWGRIESFEILTDGRLLVRGERDGFEQFWEKMRRFEVRYGVFPEGSDDNTEPAQAGMEMMLAAGRARGVDLREDQSSLDQTHPVIKRGISFHYCWYWWFKRFMQA